MVPSLTRYKAGRSSFPFLYLMYDNDLLWELENSNLGLRVFNINCGNPAVADDKLVLSLAKIGIDVMVNICKNHSDKWRYEFQPPKCTIVVYNESPLDYRISKRIWNMGDARLEEDVLYKHLGVCLNKYLYIDDNVKEAANKLKGTLLSLTNSGIHDGGLNPLTSKRIYKAVVIPKALYGCELWNSLLPKHMEILEKAHRFCVRFIQSLPRSTSTDVAFTLLNLNCIEYDIDYRKLIFFGQLCNLPPQYCIKEFFIHRLIEYRNRANIMREVIADIYRILGKYSLMDFFNRFEVDGVFVSKFTWKRVVRANMKMFSEREWRIKVETSESAKSITKITQINPRSICFGK